MNEVKINDIVLDEIKNTVINDQEETYRRIKMHMNELLFFADNKERRKDIMEAYRRLMSEPFDELLTMHEQLKPEPYRTFYLDEPLRNKVCKSEIHDRFYLEDDFNEEQIYSIEYKMHHKGKLYLLLCEGGNHIDEEDPEVDFWEYIPALNPEEDQLVKVEDYDMKKELSDHFQQIIDGIED